MAGGGEEATKKLYGCSVATAVVLYVCITCFFVVLASPNYIETSAKSSLGTNSVDFGFFYSCAKNDYNSAFSCASINENCETSSAFIMSAYGYTVWQTTSTVTYNYSQFAALSGHNVQIFNECDLFNATRSSATIYVFFALISSIFMVFHTCKLNKFRNNLFLLNGILAFLMGILSFIFSSIFKNQTNFFYGASPDTSEKWGYSMILFGVAFALFSLTSVIFGVISHRLLVNAEKEDGGAAEPLISSEARSTSSGTNPFS